MRAKTRVFYVYHHLRGDTRVPFYVGKGCRNRFRSTKGRNRYWRFIAARDGWHPEIVFPCLSESEALRKEIELIQKYRAAGYSLANFTDGGEGVSGYTHSEERLEKMREKARGRLKSQEHRQRIGEAHKGMKRSKAARENMARSSRVRKPFMCVENGRVYYSLKEASEDLGLHFSTISKNLQGHNSSLKYTFRYVSETDY